MTAARGSLKELKERPGRKRTWKKKPIKKIPGKPLGNKRIHGNFPLRGSAIKGKDTGDWD